MGSSPCSKGVLLFILLQISLSSFVRGQVTPTADPTATPGTDVTSGGTDVSTGGTDSPTGSPLPNTAVTVVTSLKPTTNTTTMNFNSTTMSTANFTTSANLTSPFSDPPDRNTSLLSCRLLTCNYTMCYSLFMNTNATTCSPADRYCELRKENMMRFSVNCVPACLTLCNDSAQNNCSVNCCGSEMCLNSSLSNLINSTMSMNSTTTSTTTNTTTKPTTVSSTTTTPATNGKKCQKISCTGDVCYQGNTNVVLCPPTQHYCMLKKATSGTVMSWTGGCSEDCSKESPCTSSSTSCFLECCNATSTSSCLKLSGVLNMPNSAPQALNPTLLITSSLLICLLSMLTSP